MSESKSNHPEQCEIAAATAQKSAMRHLHGSGAAGSPGPINGAGEVGGHGIAPGAQFNIEEITNGYVVTMRRHWLDSSPERHFAPDLAEVGKLVTAAMVRWYIEK